jgi:hypothetical protein
MSDINVHDCVQLIHGYTTKMSVSAINAENQTATCVWLDTKSRRYIMQELPLNVLKKIVEPPPIQIEGILNELRL